VVGFLTPEWFELLDEFARAVPTPAGFDTEHRLVLGQEVYGAPAGMVRYQVTLDAGGMRLAVDPDQAADQAADLTFVCDYATASALARGVTNAQAALMDGALQLRGDVERLSAARDALLALGDVFARVREATDF
jgi:hypothetical protein